MALMASFLLIKEYFSKISSGKFSLKRSKSIIWPIKFSKTKLFKPSVKLYIGEIFPSFFNLCRSSISGLVTLTLPLKKSALP